MTNTAHTPTPRIEAVGNRVLDTWLDGGYHVICTADSYANAASVAERLEAHDALTARVAELEAALRDLVVRCDGAEGVQADGSNMDTTAAHAALGDFEKTDDYDYESDDRNFDAAREDRIFGRGR